MERINRRRTVAGLVTTLLLIGLCTATTASARTSSPVLKSWKMPASYHYEVASGLSAIWVANADEYHNASIYRINPSSNAMTLVTTLRFPIGAMKVGYGSLWVSDYFGNAVYRISPSGAIQARIPVGLQPQWIHLAFGSVWSSNHHGGSVSRIDPTTNAVIATLPVGDQSSFRNGPQDLADDGTQLYAVSSNLTQLQTINPSTETVTTAPGSSGGDGFCGVILFAGGHLWSPDNCTGTTYLLNPDGTVAQTIGINGGAGIVNDIAALGTSLWLAADENVDPDSGFGYDGVLEQRDPVSGALLSSIALGGDLQTVTSGSGDLWVWDAAADQVRRVRV